MLYLFYVVRMAYVTIRLALLSGIPRIPPNPKVIFQILNSHEKLHKTLKTVL